MKVKDVDDLDENLQVKVSFQHAYVGIIGSSKSSCLFVQFNHHLDANWPANINSQHAHVWIFWAAVANANEGNLNVLSSFGVHFMTDSRTNGRIAF